MAPKKFLGRSYLGRSYIDLLLSSIYAETYRSQKTLTQRFMEKCLLHLTRRLGFVPLPRVRPPLPIAQRLLNAADQAALESILNARPWRR